MKQSSASEWGMVAALAIGGLAIVGAPIALIIYTFLNSSAQDHQRRVEAEAFENHLQQINDVGLISSAKVQIAHDSGDGRTVNSLTGVKQGIGDQICGVVNYTSASGKPMMERFIYNSPAKRWGVATVESVVEGGFQDVWGAQCPDGGRLLATSTPELPNP